MSYLYGQGLFRWMLSALPEIIKMSRVSVWGYSYFPLFTHHKYRPKKGGIKHKVRGRKVRYGKK